MFRFSTTRRSLCQWLAVGLIAGLCLQVAGCQNAVERQLRGTWKLEGAEQLAELMTGGSKPKDGLGSLIDSAVEMVAEQVEASMEIEFGSGGRLVSRTIFGGQQAEKQGTWKSVRSTQETVVIWCQLEQDDPTEITVTIVDDKTIKMVPPNIAVLNKSFTFHRVQE